MRGNWLFFRNKVNAFAFQVEQITRRKVGYHAVPGENRMYYLYLQQCHPIPLDARQLEKNGFERKEEYEKYELHVGEAEVWVILHDSGDDGEKHHCLHIEGNERRGIPVHYHNTVCSLHELQNALRLCGIEKEIIAY